MGLLITIKKYSEPENEVEINSPERLEVQALIEKSLRKKYSKRICIESQKSFAIFINFEKTYYSDRISMAVFQN